MLIVSLFGGKLDKMTAQMDTKTVLPSGLLKLYSLRVQLMKNCIAFRIWNEILVHCVKIQQSIINSFQNAFTLIKPKKKPKYVISN